MDDKISPAWQANSTARTGPPGPADPARAATSRWARLGALLRRLARAALLGTLIFALLAAAVYGVTTWQMGTLEETLTGRLEARLTAGDRGAGESLAALQVRLDELAKKVEALERQPAPSPSPAPGEAQTGPGEATVALVRKAVGEKVNEELGWRLALFTAQEQLLGARVELAAGNRGRAVEEVRLALTSLDRAAAGLAATPAPQGIAPSGRGPAPGATFAAQGLPGAGTALSTERLAEARQVLARAYEDLSLNLPAAADRLSLAWHLVSEVAAGFAPPPSPSSPGR